MTEHSPPSKASAFALSAAILHTDGSAHPDSEAFVKRERHRLSRELKTVYESESPEPSSHKQLPPSAPQTIPASSIRSCRSLGRSSLRAGNTSSPSSHLSQATTAEDSQGPEAQGSGRYRLRRQVPHWYDPVVKFWTSQVSVTIDEGSYRDHLALERTFLGYLRTSLAFAVIGVIIAQLFRLQHTANPNKHLGFFVLGIPLATIFITFGVVVLLVGAFRFWRQQNVMLRGKVYAGGWEIVGIMGVSVLLCLVAFVLVTAIDIEKSFF